MNGILRLYHGSPEENFVPTFGLGNEWYGKYNRRDSNARSKMYDLIQNDPRNDLSITFKDVL